jgi:hypothetical protein
MGYELYRMIRDGAPASWTAAMWLVAATIADDARDPRQPGPDDDDGLPWSAITIRGERKKGKWHDGLVQRTGLSERSISRALTDLARSGYEMREEAATDKHGRPVFAYPGRRPRFRVPPLKPRDEPIDAPGGRSPDTSTIRSPDTSATRSPDTSTIRSPDTSTTSAPKVARNGTEGRQIRSGRSPDTSTQSPHSPPTVKPSSSSTGSQQLPGRGPRGGQDDDDSETRSAPEPGPQRATCGVCGGTRYRLDGDGLLPVHGPRHSRCKGSGHPPAEAAEPGEDQADDDFDPPF